MKKIMTIIVLLCTATIMFAQTQITINNTDLNLFEKQNEVYFYNHNVGIGVPFPKRRLVIASEYSQAQIILNDNVALSGEKNWFLQSRKGQFRIGTLGDPIVNTKIGNLFTISQLGFVGIGNTQPTAKLQITDGDIYIDNINRGVIMKSPNGQCWRMTVSNSGESVFEMIECPH